MWFNIPLKELLLSEQTAVDTGIALSINIEDNKSERI
jgi:hypothetical protein